MATSLRDMLISGEPTRAPLLGNDHGYMTPGESAQLDATGGNTLTNAFTGARLGNQANTLGAQESSLRAAGDPASLSQAVGLRSRITDLQAQSQAYAAPIGRYEDIGKTGNYLGDAASFAAGQLGQGFGSSVDQIATGSAMGLGATALGLIPHPLARAASIGLRALTPVELYRQNANLNKGEAYNGVVNDPIAMQRSATDINDTVSNHGYRAAIMDTLPQLLPVGQIGGGFGKALKKIPTSAKLVGAPILEGVTETGQQVSQQYAQSALNPNRDTSGDRSDLANSFIGGVIGSGGMTAAGYAAEAGFRRLGTKGDGVNGDALPLNGQPGTAPGVTPGVTPIVAPKNLAEYLATPDTKDADIAARSDLLKGIPPANVSVEETEAWMSATAPERQKAVLEELDKLPKDAKAQQLRAAIASATGPIDAMDALDAAGMYAAEKSGAAQASFAAAERIKVAAAAATKNKRKNSMQVSGTAIGARSDVETVGTDGLTSQLPGQKVSASDLGSRRGAEGGVDATKAGAVSPAVEEARAVEQARRDLTKKLLVMKGQDTGFKAEQIGDLADELSHELAAMAQHGKGNKPTPGELARAARVGRTLRDLLGNSAPMVMGHIARTFKAESSPTMQAAMDRINAEVGPMPAKANAQDRETAAQGLVDLIPPEVQSRLLASKIDLTDPEARERLLRNIEDFADGTSDFALMPARKLFGKETFDAMLEHVGQPIQRREGKQTEVGSQEEDVAQSDESALSSDDVGGDMASMTDGMRSEGEQSQFEIDGEERSLNAVAPESMAFYHGTDEGTVRTSAQAWDERKDKNGVMQLPQLLRLDTNTARRKADTDEAFAERTAPGGAERTLAKRLKDLRGKAEASLGQMRDRYIVASTSAQALMDRQNMQPSKRAELFFKYAEKEKNPHVADLREAHKAASDLAYMDRAMSDIVVNRQSVSPSGQKLSIAEASAVNAPRINLERLRELVSEQDAARIDALIKEERTSKSTLNEKTGDYESKGTVKKSIGMARIIRSARKVAEQNLNETLALDPAIKAYMDKVRAERGAAPEFGEVVNNFFAEHLLVTAEQDSNRDYLQMNMTEFRDMAAKGAANYKAAWLSVKDLGWAPGSAAETGKLNEARASMNLIHFESEHATGKEGVVSVPAYLLVDWVRSLRKAHVIDTKEGGGDVRGKSQNMTRQTEDYKRDLLEGITAMTQGGLTDGLPWIVNAKGEREDFKQRGLDTPSAPGQRNLFEDDKGSLPPSLDLNGITDQKAMFNRAFGADKRRSETEESESGKFGSTVKSLKEQAADRARDKELAAEPNDVQDADAVAKAEEEAGGSRTRDAQREDVAINSAIISSAADAAPRAMARGRALNSASKVAEGLWRDYTGSKGAAHARALGRIQAYLNSSERPAFNEGDELAMTGGEHYVFPLAALLTPRHMAEVAARHPNDLRAMAQLRSQVAGKLYEMANPSEGYPRIKAGELGKLVDAMSGYNDRVAQAKLDKVVPEDEVQRKEWETGVAHRLKWDGGARIVAKKRSEFLAEIAKDFVPAEGPAPAATKPFTDRSGTLPKNTNLAVGGLSDERVAEATKRLAAGVKAEASVAQMEQQLAQAEAEVKALRERDMSAGPSRAGGEKLSEMSALADKVNKLKARLIERNMPTLGAVTTGSDKTTDVSATQGELAFSPSRTTTDNGEVIAFQPNDPNRQITRKKKAGAQAAPYEALGVPRTTGLAPFLSAETVEMRTAETNARNDAVSRTMGALVESARAKPVVAKSEAPLLANPPVAPAAHRGKETAKLAGADMILAPASTQGYAGDLGRAANAEGKLYATKANADMTGKTLLVSVPGRGRGFTAMPEMIRRVMVALDAGAAVRTDNKDNATRDHNAEGEGALRAALVEAGYSEKSGPDFSTWSKETVKNNDQVANSTLPATTTPVAEVNNPSAIPAPNDAEIFKARAYIGKVLGPKVTALFEKMFPDMTGSADWSDAKQTIRIATGSPVSVMQRAYHESMHGFFSNILKNHPETREMMQRALSTPEVSRRLEYLLKASPKAVASMKADPEEAVAYAYQFWAAGMLTIGAKPKNFFEKVQAFFRRVLGMVRESDKTLAIFEAFHDGKLVEPSVAGQAIAKVMATGEWQAKFLKRFDKQVQAVYSEVMTAHDVLRSSESATLRGLSTQWWANPGDPTSAGQTGVIDRRGIKTNQYESRLHAVLDALSGENQERDLEALVGRMNGDKAEVSPEVEDAAVKLHALLDHYYKYAKSAGLKMGERDMGKYWPVIWDLEKMVEQKDAFVTMLTTKYPMQLRSALATIQKANPNVTTVEEVAQAMHQAIVDRGGVDEGALDAHREDGILTPYFASQNTRTFDWIKAADRQPFLSTDIVSTATRYLHQGVRAAEYVRGFGEGGQMLRDTMAREGDVQEMTADGPIKYAKDGPVVTELKAAANDLKLQGKEADEWIARRMEDAQRAMGAMEGVLGKDISAGARKFQSAAMVYQGLRVLSLSLFSAMLDPNGIKVAGGTTQNMLDAYVHGLKNVVGTWKDVLTGGKLRTRGDDQDLANAETVGAISPTMFLEGMGAAHTSEYTAGPARKINRALFLANGLTAWDRSMRIMAVKAAMESIASNEKNASPAHSARWLKDLGLKQGDVTLDADGHLVIDRHSIAAFKGISADEAAAEALKVHTAVNRWVNRAIVSPNAAQRPARASDPHYAMFYQLKQFTYSFQKTTMLYAFNEAKAGNTAAMGQMAMGMPIMIAADVSKAVLTGGGSLPGYMANWTMADWLAHSWNRAGLSGVGQFGIDALHDPLGTIGGPTISQAVNAVTHPVGETLLSAVPGLNKLSGLAQAVKDIE